MSEDPLRTMKELLIEIQRAYDQSEAFFKKMEPEFKSNIETYGKLRDNEQTDLRIRSIAAYTTCNECNISIILITEKMTLNLMSRLALSTTLAMMHIHNELKQLKEPSALPTKMDLEKISNIEKELTRLKRVTKQWKPIIDDFIEGRERTRKYLSDHR